MVERREYKEGGSKLGGPFPSSQVSGTPGSGRHPYVPISSGAPPQTLASLPPQGPESMVSRQEVKPGSPSLGKSVLPWRKEKTGAASGQRVAGRTLPGGLA